MASRMVQKSLIVDVGDTTVLKSGTEERNICGRISGFVVGFAVFSMSKGRTYHGIVSDG